jgi:hypothetical protein
MVASILDIRIMLNTMSTPRLVRTAVEKALDALPPDARDSGTQQLALVYAALIDDSAIAAKYRDALDTIERNLSMDDPKSGPAFRKITDALARHSVASDLGPKLLATLAQLGLTPVARNALTGGGQGGPPVESALDELRAARSRRQRAR